MLCGTLRFKPLQPNSNKDNIDVVNEIRSRLGLEEITGITPTLDEVKLYIEGTYSIYKVKKEERVSFNARMKTNLEYIDMPDPFNHLDNTLQYLRHKERYLTVKDKSIDIQQYISDIDKKPLQTYTEENIDNLTYLGHIFKAIKLVYDEKLNKQGDSFHDYELSYQNNDEDIDIEITVKDGNISRVMYNDGYSSLTLEDQYAKPVIKVTGLKQVKLDTDNTKRLIALKDQTNSVKEELLLKFKTNKGFFKNIDEVIKAHPDKDISWISEKKYYIVEPDNFIKVKEYLEKFKLKALDTETTGLQVDVRSETGNGDFLVGIIITPRRDESYYFPLAHDISSDIVNLPTSQRGIPPLDVVKDFMQEHFKKSFENDNWICHNTEFDWRAIWTCGISLNVVIDTLYLFKETLFKEGKLKSVALKYLSKEILNRDSLELSDLMVNGEFDSDEYDFTKLPKDLTKYYACPDGDNTFRLLEYAVSTKLMEKYEVTELIEIETQFQKVKAYSRYYGMKFNVKNAIKLNERTLKLRDQYEREWREEVERLGGNPNNGKNGLINPGSAPDRVYAFYEVAKCEPEFKTAKGGYSVNADAIKTWSKQYDKDGNPKYPLAVIYKKLNETNTLLKSFIASYEEHVDENGIFYSSSSDLATGRVNSTNPNYQSFNKDVKQEIIPRKGYFLIDYDYSSIESRIIAALSGQKDLNDAMKDPNTDWHRIQASRTFKISYELVTEEKRGSIKPINFGLPYGMSKYGLAHNNYGNISEISLAKAQKDIDEYFAPQPQVKKMFEDLQAFAKKNLYSKTYSGRRRYYSTDEKTYAKIGKEGGNAPIQGMGADVYKRQLGKLFKILEEKNWLGKLLINGFIHDEALLEVSYDIDLGELFPILINTLEYRNGDFCPFFIGIGFGGTWYQAKSTEISVNLQYELMDNKQELSDLSASIFNGDLRREFENPESAIHKEWIKRFSKYNKENGIGVKDVKMGTILNLWLVERIKKFNIDYVSKYLQDKENHEKAITPVVFSRLIEVLEDSVELSRDELGKTSLNEKLDIFYEFTGTTKVNTIYTAEEYSEIHKKETPKETENEYEVLEEDSEEERKRKKMIMAVKEMGYYLYNPFETKLALEDFTVKELNALKKIVINKDRIPDIQENISIFNQDDNGYKVIFYDTKEDKYFKTNYSIKDTNLSKLRQVMFKQVY